MNTRIDWQKAAVIAAIVLFAGWSGAVNYAAAAAEPAKHSCTALEFRQFDFWVGDWDAFDVDNPATPVARTRVERILDGCVLREDYQDTNGLKGQSFSIYDVGTKMWHQSWVTNRGQWLLLAGRMQGVEMVLRGSDHTADGKERLVRGTWKPANGGVRETAVNSTDGGKTWKPWFDILFRPHKH